MEQKWKARSFMHKVVKYISIVLYIVLLFDNLNTGYYITLMTKINH
jgi:hypothetical protein